MQAAQTWNRTGSSSKVTSPNYSASRFFSGLAE